jgi:hypothetical protein
MGGRIMSEERKDQYGGEAGSGWKAAWVRLRGEWVRLEVRKDQVGG